MTALPPSPFLSSACSHQAEALPATVPGKDHSPPAGRSIPIDYEALFDSMLPPEPPPIFLRKPSQAFMRALFELSR
jgi:hypothetical protein